MGKLEELQKAFSKAWELFNETDFYLDSLKVSEKNLEVAIESIYSLNAANSTGISTEPLYEVLWAVQAKIKATEPLVAIGQNAIDVARDSLDAYHRFLHN